MRYLGIISLLFCISSVAWSQEQKWKSSSCGPHMSGVENAIDCTIEQSSAVDWCYSALKRRDIFDIHSIQVSGKWSVRCAYYRTDGGSGGKIVWAKIMEV